MDSRRFTSLALGSAAAVLARPPGAFAQAGTIKFVIGTAPGGAIDPYARIVADPMAKALGQTIIVE
jgi:tripartite-type tricarboxylate transporter receptor subunit TctC